MGKQANPRPAGPIASGIDFLTCSPGADDYPGLQVSPPLILGFASLDRAEEATSGIPKRKGVPRKVIRDVYSSRVQLVLNVFWQWISETHHKSAHGADRFRALLKTNQ